MNTVIRTITACAIAAALATACSKEDPHAGHDHGPGAHEHDGDAGSGSEGEDHGERVALGTVELLGHAFEVAGFGDAEAGKECAFEVAATGDAAGLSPFLWIENAAGDQIGGPENGSLEDGKLHYHVTPRADGGKPVRVVLRLRHDGKDERAGLPLDGHGHEHPDTPHDGIVAALKDASGTTVGHVELKLHDDKGDLELWIATDAEIAQPLDLPLDATPSVSFVDHDGRRLELAVRNAEQNEDEDGTANVRDGKTNYFIFPGDSGADAKWLMGKDFRSIVSVSVTRDGATLTSDEFVLKPHTH